jgi:hydroxymethylpyrimidine/phosphomethylpyrimidine kinase
VSTVPPVSQRNGTIDASVSAVLVIGGVDSSGGAGLSKDVRTLTELGVDSLCVATAITAQTNSEVIAVHHVPPPMISAQIRSALVTRQVSAVKIGMLGTAASVQAVADSLLAHRDRIPVVLDPVLTATSGGVLLDDEGREALRKQLLPLATLVTPNLPETVELLGPNSALSLNTDPTSNEGAVLTQAQQLLTWGPAAVLLKGGHGTGDQAVDYLVSSSGIIQRFALPRVPVSQRGTGCALASAIAAALGAGATLEKACYEAKTYVHSLLCKPHPSSAPRNG